MEIIQKWGFGMAPLKPTTDRLNRKAINVVKGFVSDEGVVASKDIVEDISRVKGIFNRVIKQDQWDWFTVNMYLDYPRYGDLLDIVSSISLLRKSILSKDDIKRSIAIDKLKQANFIIYCENYLSFDINKYTSAEYLYILSRREEKDILKIGMTTRNVQKRVTEINSATGVIFPYSARKVYKVKDSRQVEKSIHSLLSKYRIRVDREFFRINYAEACSIIEDYLIRSNQFYYE